MDDWGSLSRADCPVFITINKPLIVYFHFFIVYLH